MSQDVNRNKIDDKQERRAEHLSDKLEKQGMGQDEAKKRAMATVAEEETNRGGSNSGGDPKKGVNHEGSKRRGSDKEAG